MRIEDLKTVFGDRVLVKRLEKPGKIGRFYVPENYRGEKSRYRCWVGEVAAYGTESKYRDSDIQLGDIVLVDPVGQDALTIEDDNGDKFTWVPDEFIAAKDRGSIREVYANV